ncbi:MAG: TRAM domain-containing protein [Bauldia sp.]
MVETVTISALGHSGDGIAEIDGERVFVPFTLPGEVVEVEQRGERAAALQILEASPDRVAPLCRHFGICGGCALQHMRRDAYLAWKREQVAAAFRQRGIAADVEPVVPIAAGTRRRAVLSAIKTGSQVTLGYHRRGSKEIVAIEECPILLPSLAAAKGTFAEIAGLALDREKEGRITAVAADNGFDVSVQGGGKMSRGKLEAIGRVGNNAAIARLTIDGVEIFRNRPPEIAAGAATLLPTPGGFVQAAASAEAALAEAVLAHVGKAKPVADFFAGIGTFTLRLARQSPVTAIEGEKSLVEALEAAVRRASGLKPVTARRRDLFVNPPSPVELAAFGAVVFDPPAAGAKALAEAIAASTVKRVAAVSCNPATLARDARILIDGGYRLVRVLPVDQFLFSAEIEAVATFERVG